MEHLFKMAEGIVSTVLQGGPSSIAAVLLMVVFLILLISHYVIKMAVSAFKEQITLRDKQLKEKDDLLEERNKKIEALIERYAEAQAGTNDTLSRVEEVMQEINIRMRIAESNKG